MPKITIIIPNYNNATYLKRCLDSVCKQTYPDIEIVCVDDKSTDNSLQILNKYAKLDARIKVIALDKNSGVSNARNTALKSISGEYVCFLDSDDYLDKNFCKDLYRSISNTKSDLACGGHIKSNKYNKLISAWLPTLDISSTPIKDIFSFTKHRNVTQKLFKTDIINKYNLQFNPELTYMEDAVFLMEYLKHCKLLSSVKKPLYIVQINMHSLCRDADLKDRREQDKAKASALIHK